jgi:hypothetical protein
MDIDLWAEYGAPDNDSGQQHSLANVRSLTLIEATTTRSQQWRLMSTAPCNTAVGLRVFFDRLGISYELGFACALTDERWVNAETGTPIIPVPNPMAPSRYPASDVWKALAADIAGR